MFAKVVPVLQIPLDAGEETGHGMGVVPVEVKAEINLQAKSMKSYCKRFSAPRAVRTSMAHFAVSRMKEGATLVDLPLYAVCRMQAELERESGA